MIEFLTYAEPYQYGLAHFACCNCANADGDNCGYSE